MSCQPHWVTAGVSLLLLYDSRAEGKLQSISKLFIQQVIIPHVCFAQSAAQILSTISELKTGKTITHILEPIYIPRALNTGTCIQQDDLFYNAGLHRNRCYTQLTQEELGRDVGKKMQVNGLEG